MSTGSPTPPPQPPAEEKPATETSSSTSSGMGWLYGAGIFSIVFTILFHAGAAYLSYQKYQSGLWALVNFFFAFFYYPYYSFFLASAPAPSQGMIMGGRRRRH